DQLFIPISITERNVVCILCISGLPDPIDEDFKRFIEMLTESLILSIKNIDYTMQMQDKVRMEMELKTASGIQSTLLPQKLPDLPQLEMHSFYEPASETGGDWFNIYPFTDELVYIFIGDVTGHGVPSALIAAGVYSLVKNYLDFSDKANPPLPSALNTAINNLICDMGKLKYFMTFLSIQLNIRTGELVYSNSAHCPAIVFSKYSYLQLQESGLLLGTPFPLIVQDSSIQLKDNDLIFLYTDGATEAENKEEEFFGEDKLLELIQDGYTKDTEFIIRSVRENISNFLNNKPLKDDITMVAIRYKNVNF
ncbi:MAG: SpoIIE family protein phosphatase, partial [Leptospiraceae bacterium]|nr:SpoIIE family protein phosphatase [Leptospiraceae bacterium]